MRPPTQHLPISSPNPVNHPIICLVYPITRSAVITTQLTSPMTTIVAKRALLLDMMLIICLTTCSIPQRAMDWLRRRTCLISILCCSFGGFYQSRAYHMRNIRATLGMNWNLACTCLAHIWTNCPLFNELGLSLILHYQIAHYRIYGSYVNQ